MKKCIFFLFILFLTILSGCSNTSKIDIIGKETIEIGYSYEYKVIYEDNEVDLDDVYLLIDNNACATLNNNTLVPNEVGTIILRAVLKEDGSIYCEKTITIIEAIVSDIYLDCEKDFIFVNEEITLDYIITPEDNTEKLYWESSDNSIATVTDGIVKGIKAGIVTISLSCASAKETIQLEIKDIITEIILNYDSDIYVNEVTYLETNILDPVFSTENTNIIIKDNYIYGKSEGKAIIHVVSKENTNLSKDFEINIRSVNYEANDATEEEINSIDEYMNKLSLSEKIGQMLFLNVGASGLDYDEKGLYSYSQYGPNGGSKTYLNDTIGDRVFSNFMLSYENTMNVTNIINAVNYWQEMCKEKNGIGAFIGVDASELADFNVLVDGFSDVYANRTVGAIDDISLVDEYYANFANELFNAGINMCINSAYTYSYDDSGIFSTSDESKQMIYSSILKNNLQNRSISIAPYINSYIWNYDLDTVSNQIDGAIKDSVDIFTTFYSSASSYNGTETINQYLYKNGYEGIVLKLCEEFLYDDNAYGSIYNAIMDGTNMFTLNIYLGRWYSNYNNEIMSIYDQLLAAASEDDTLMNKINESVRKILLLKIRNNVIEGTYTNQYFVSTSSNNEAVTNLTKDGNAIKIDSTYTGLDESQIVHVFSTVNTSRSDYYSNQSSVSYNLPTKFLTNCKKHYTSIDNYLITDNTYSTRIDTIEENDQVIIALYSNTISYSYEDEDENTITAYLHWNDIIKEVKEKTDNIILVFMDNPDLDTYFTDYNYPKIYVNYSYNSEFTDLIKILEYGK